MPETYDLTFNVSLACLKRKLIEARSSRNLDASIDIPCIQSCSNDLFDNQVQYITHDSRKVKAHTLYVGLKGRQTHGARFLNQVLSQGASAVALPADTPFQYLLPLLENNLNLDETSLTDLDHLDLSQLRFKLPVLWLSPDQQRYEMAQLADWVYDSPLKKKAFEKGLSLIGITGTNGKTTTSTLLADILTLYDGDAGLIGTIETRGGGIKQVSNMTTMESPDLHAHYRALLDAGVQHCVMEVSSIGICESRVAASSYQRAAFLNLSEDHLDYHLDMHSYAQAKLRLFSELLSDDSLSIICLDGTTESKALAKDIIEVCQQRTLSYWRYSSQIIDQAESLQAEIYWRTLSLSEFGISGCLRTPKGEIELSSPLMGDFNASNLAVAASIALSLDLPAKLIQSALKHSMIKGRMEAIHISNTSMRMPPEEMAHQHRDDRIEQEHPLPSIRVDYAHSPDAIERAVHALKAHCKGRLWVLFGCGGDRDQSKRPLMGEACRGADGVVLTSDNPRNEAPEEIMAQVISGLEEAQFQPTLIKPSVGHYWCEVDRGVAIHALIAHAQPHDLILIAGKGHEPYQELSNGYRVPFSDQEHARQALELKAQKIHAHAHRHQSERININALSLNSQQLCADAGGLLLYGQHQALLGASIDSRTLSFDQQLAFFCLQGQRDGHEFIESAIEKGAAALVVRREWSPTSTTLELIKRSQTTIIAVTDPERALNLWAQAHRRRVFNGVMIGLTGSNGKTSTKELLASALAQLGSCLSTQGNYNNHLGVPLTLLRLRSEHEFAVIEMGMNAPGEIAQLTQWVLPDLGLITTISTAHLEGLGSIEAIAAAKGELITHSLGKAVFMPASISIDLRRAASYEALNRAKTEPKYQPNVYLLPHRSADQSENKLDHEHDVPYTLRLDQQSFALDGSRAQIYVHQKPYDFNLALLGEHQQENARLALTVAISAWQLSLSVSDESLHAQTSDPAHDLPEPILSKLLYGLSICRPASLRGEILKYPRPIGSKEHEASISEQAFGRLWLDCYNANPQSMLASVKTFFNSGVNRGVLILGQIGELGERSGDLHRQLGLDLAQEMLVLKPKKCVVFTVGFQAQKIGEGLMEARATLTPFTQLTLKHFEIHDIEQIVEALKDFDPKNILVKGSRSVRLERLIDPLLARPVNLLARPVNPLPNHSFSHSHSQFHSEE